MAFSDGAAAGSFSEDPMEIVAETVTLVSGLQIEP